MVFFWRLNPLELTPLLGKTNALILIHREPGSCVWGEGGRRRMSRLFPSRSLMRDSWDISVCPQCECTEGGAAREQWEPWQDRLGQDLCKTFSGFSLNGFPGSVKSKPIHNFTMQLGQGCWASPDSGSKAYRAHCVLFGKKPIGRNLSGNFNEKLIVLAKPKMNMASSWGLKQQFWPL